MACHPLHDLVTILLSFKLRNQQFGSLQPEKKWSIIVAISILPWKIMIKKVQVSPLKNNRIGQGARNMFFFFFYLALCVSVKNAGSRN